MNEKIEKPENKERQTPLFIEIPEGLKEKLKIEAATRHTSLREIVLNRLTDQSKNINC